MCVSFHNICMSCFLHSVSLTGYDKQDRPVSWRRLGKFDMKSVLKLTTLKQLMDFHHWEVEQLLRLARVRSSVSGVNIETFVVIIDVAEWTISQASRDAYAFVKGENKLITPVTTYTDHSVRLGVIKLSYHCIVLLLSLSHFSIVRNYHTLLQFNALF